MHRTLASAGRIRPGRRVGTRAVPERDRGAHGPARPARSAPKEARRDGRVSARYLELVCPAGTPAALRAAVNAGADAVYCGFRDCTNARNYPGLNFDPDELREGIAYAHGSRLQGAGGHQYLSARRGRGALASRGRSGGGSRRRCGDPGRHRRPRLRHSSSSGAAAPPVGAGLGGQRAARSRSTARTSTSSAWCCRGCCRSRTSPSTDRRERHRDRGVRLRQRRADVGRALLPVLVSHGPVADKRRRLRPGEPRQLSSRRTDACCPRSAR